MKSIRKRSIFLCVLVFLLTFITVSAILWSPQVHRELYPDDMTFLYELTSEDVEITNNCTVDSKGCVEVTGKDPYIVFQKCELSGKKVVVNFSEPLASDTEAELFYNEIWGFTESEKITNNCVKGDLQTTFLLDSNNYKQLRLDIDIPFQFESIEVYEIGAVETPVESNPFWWMWATIISVVAMASIYFVDKRFAVADYLMDKLVLLWKNFKANVLYLLGICVVSAIASLVMVGVPPQGLFQIYEIIVLFLFFSALLNSVFCIWKYRKNLIDNFEKVFVIILLLIGVLLVIIAPQAHSSWDTDVHYRLALEASYWGDAKLTETDVMIKNAKEYAWLTLDPRTNFTNLLSLTAGYDNVIETYEAGVSLAHIPAGIFIALGRLLGFPFVIIFMMGKLANLLVYATVSYFGLKKLKSGKLLYAVIALFPTNVLVACSYSYDYWVTGFTLLGMAYYISIFQQKDEHISTWDTIVMCIAFGLGCVPKAIYVPLMVIPFILPKSRMKDSKKYYNVCFVALLVILAIFAIAAFGETTGEGDSRGGVGISPVGQIAFIFGNIFKYAAILLKFLLVDYLSVRHMDMYISNWSYIGWSGIEVPARGTVVVLILLLLTFLFDKDKAYLPEERTGWRNRIYVLLLYFGGSVLIATALYLVFNPVGSDTIVGCQHRYITPWIYPLLSIWSLNGIKPVISKKVLCWMVTIGMFGLLYYDIFTVVLPTVVAI